MSDHFHVNSLRAAKSKANYLFEGNFRRKPNQNLSGASRSLARGELLQQAAEERQNREDVRRKELASLKLQSFWRGYCCRIKLAKSMREKFDITINDILNDKTINQKEFDDITSELVIYYHMDQDVKRFNILSDYISRFPNIITNHISNNVHKTTKPSPWLYKLIRLLVINLRVLEKNCDTSNNSKYIQFLEKFTNPSIIIDNSNRATIWRILIDNRIYTMIRNLIDRRNKRQEEVEVNNEKIDDKFESLIIELLYRSLDTTTLPLDQKQSITTNKTKPVLAFFKEFLKGPFKSNISDIYFPKLLNLKPRGLNASYILSIFKDSQTSPSALMIPPSLSSDPIKECNDAIWFCNSFVTTIHSQIDSLLDEEKENYFNILSKFINPAEYITTLSLMLATNNEDTDEMDTNESEDDEFDPISINQISQYYTEINCVITKLVNLINDANHVNGLKSIIFNSELQNVQNAIIQISNLMLSHEPLAIFNCRLLYTVAFNREFSRSLWKSITSANLPGSNDSPIYVQLTLGNNISYEAWRIILPKLRLFCSIYSYLIPTIDDEEFYSSSRSGIETSDEANLIDFSPTPSSPPKDGKTSTITSNAQHEPKTNLRKLRETTTTTTATSSSSNSRSYFIDKELVTISAILRDICVGFIDIMYQDSRRSNNYYASSSGHTYRTESDKLLSFEMKVCFKAMVRLLCQLHAGDSRKQFCPDGHWISPSLVIPANKAIDFQLLNKQQGRLIRQITKDDDKSDRSTVSASEIKSALILQEIPFVFSFQDRVQILHQLLRREKSIHQPDTANYLFGLPGGAIMVQVRRNYIYEDAFEKLSTENEPNMKLPLKVSLINTLGAVEAGIDGGGLTKEFLSELLKAGFDPMRGFFKSTKDQLLYPNPSANVLFANLPEGYSVHYEFLGRILGKAIFEKIMVELPLASFFLAKLLARRHSSDVDLHNLASLDPVLYKNLVYLKNYKGDVADLNLDFTISNNEFDEHEVVELKPGGSNIPVTRENRIEYVHLVADYRLNKQIRAQCAAFKRGISQLIDLDWIRMFDSRELQILISGAPTLIDIEDWKRHTLYANGYTDDCEVIRTFWRVVGSLNETKKRQLLRFATSCSLPPLLGFRDLIPQFTIAPSEEERLPTASTCINLLKLPACEDEATLRSKLLYAIDSNAGFELS